MPSPPRFVVERASRRSPEPFHRRQLAPGLGSFRQRCVRSLALIFHWAYIERVSQVDSMQSLTQVGHSPNSQVFRIRVPTL